MVVLEGDGAAVLGEEVGFNDQPPLTPEEIDLPAAELDVDLGRWETVTAVEIEECGLEVGAGVVALDAFEVMAFVLGLANRATEEVRREQG